MPAEESKLFIKRSNIPAAGKGLFTSEAVAKGTRIVEYKGKITSWKDAAQANGTNLYIYYVNKDYVIDASGYQKSLARYANDATGPGKIKGLTNNCHYVKDGMRIFIESLRPIAAGEEILVSYGKGYWDTVKENTINKTNSKL